MRRPMIRILLTLCLAVTADAQQPPPAATPSEAMVRYFEALSGGDEEALRRVVFFREPAAGARAVVRAQLAAVQLHRAAREHGVTGKRIVGTTGSRDERLMVMEPVPSDWMERVRPSLEKMEWKIDGDVATPAPGGPIGGAPGNLRFERIDGAWMMIVSDALAQQNDQQIRQAIEAQTFQADAIGVAIDQIKLGKLRTFREVNDFIDAEKERVAERFLAAQEKEPKGPIVLVADAETGAPVAGA